MAKKKYDCVESKPLYSGKNKDGSRKRIGTRVTNSDGVVTILRTPNGKAAKYAEELKGRIHLTNDGKVKTTKQGKEIRLTDTEAAFRSGYLACQSDSAKAYNGQGGNK